jgi:hypothetical protein
MKVRIQSTSPAMNDRIELSQWSPWNLRLAFKDGIAYDSKKIVESLKGKVGR